MQEVTKNVETYLLVVQEVMEMLLCEQGEEGIMLRCE